MRDIKLASLLILGVGALALACTETTTDETDADGSGAGTGVGASSGSGGGSGSGSGGSGTGGGGTEPDPSRCAATTLAMGDNPVIDDFTDADARTPPFSLPEEADGRAGQWVHGHWQNWSFAQPEIGDDAGNAYMQIKCTDEEWCNTDWDMADPWVQSAAVDTLFQLYAEPVKNCYNVQDIYTGIKFRAKSGDGMPQKVWLQIITPDALPDEGISYRSPVQSITADWQEFEVPFTAFAIPSWATAMVSAPLSLSELRSIAFVVRNVESQTDDMGMEVGEKLLPYNILLDDIAFME